MSGPESSGGTNTASTEAGFGIPGVPPISPNATNEEKDAHWFKHAYQGDKMPQLTLRAVLTGGILGMMLAASNLYTTLNIGWAFGVAITASVVSFVIWSIITPIVKCRKMTILETNCMASTASAAGYSTGSTIATMFGALVLLQMSPPDMHKQQLAFEKAATSGTFSLVYGATEPTKTTSLAFDAKPEDVVAALEALGDIEPREVKVSAISTGGWALTFANEKQNLAVVGIADDTTDTKLAQRYNTWDIHPVWLVASFTFVTGLMGVFLAIPMKRQMINHEQLPFPSGIAAAETLRSLYSASKEATRKAYVLVIGLGIGAVIAILRTGSGILQNIDTLWLQLGNVLPYMVGPKDAADPSKGLEVKSGPIPEHLPHDGFSTLHGKIMNGFSIDTGGLLVAAGMIVGIRVSLSMLIGSCILYFWLGPMLAEADHAAVLASTPNYIKNIDVTGDGKQYLFMRWGLWGGTALMVMASLTALAFQWKTIVRAFSARKGSGDESAASLAAMDQIEVPFVWMVIGMIPITIAMVIIQYVAFNISWWAGLIAVAMSFVLSLVASRATGETDTTPIGAMGKVMQLLFAFLKPGQIGPNLASAGIAANSASSCADLLTDLKIGYLLGANPRRQFLAQFWGVFFGTVAIVPIWFLMVPTKAKLESLPAPATRTWEKVAKVLTEGIDSLPQSAQVAILVGAAVGVLLPLIEKFVIPAKYRKYMISATGLGLAFMLPFYNSLAFTIGAVIALLWAKWNKRTADLYTVPLASGLVAGESLIAAFIAMLATASGLMGWNL